MKIVYGILSAVILFTLGVILIPFTMRQIFTNDTLFNISVLPLSFLWGILVGKVMISIWEDGKDNRDYY